MFLLYVAGNHKGASVTLLAVFYVDKVRYFRELKGNNHLIKSRFWVGGSRGRAVLDQKWSSKDILKGKIEKRACQMLEHQTILRNYDECT